MATSSALSVTEALALSEGDELVGRLPIGRIRGPALSAYYHSMEDRAREIMLEAQDKLAQNIANQVELILKLKGVA